MEGHIYRRACIPRLFKCGSIYVVVLRHGESELKITGALNIYILIDGKTRNNLKLNEYITFQRYFRMSMKYIKSFASLNSELR